MDKINLQLCYVLVETRMCHAGDSKFLPKCVAELGQALYTDDMTGVAPEAVMRFQNGRGLDMAFYLLRAYCKKYNLPFDNNDFETTVDRFGTLRLFKGQVLWLEVKCSSIASLPSYQHALRLAGAED